MKQSLIILFLVLTTKLTFSATDHQVYQYCKIWGYVKYFNKDIHKNKLDWEDRFLENWGYFKQIKSTGDFNLFINNQLDEVIRISKLDTTLTNSRYMNINKTIDQLKYETWFHELHGSTQKKMLAILYNYKPCGIKNAKGGKAITKIEDPLYANKKPSDSFYMLGLFRLWNNINFLYPYHDLLDYNWDTVLNIVIPQFRLINSRGEYVQALKRLSFFLQDSHVWINDKENTNPYRVLPFNIRCIENKMIIGDFVSDSLRKISALKKGDIIYSIDHKHIDSLLKYLQYYSSYSTETAFLYSISNTLWYSKKIDSFQTFRVLRGNDTIKEEVQSLSNPAWWKIYKNRDKGPTYQIMKDSIGYIDMTSTTFSGFNKAYKKIKNMPYLILDCRGYGSGAFLKLNKKLKNKSVDVSSYYYPDTRNPGNFLNGKNQNYYFENNFSILLKLLGIIPSHWGKIFPTFKKTYQGKVYVLINEKAISFGETVIMSIKSYRPDVVLIGSHTTGANGNVTTLNLPLNTTINYTGLNWMWADGKVLQRRGVIPNIAVTPRLEDYIMERDTILEYTIKKIQNNN